MGGEMETHVCADHNLPSDAKATQRPTASLAGPSERTDLQPVWMGHGDGARGSDAAGNVAVG
ncbi:hypothetical protein GCM10027269_64430 [Kribbella endophytica]